MMSISANQQEAEAISRLGEWQRPREFQFESIDGDVARLIEPSLSRDVLSAEYAANVGALSVHNLTRACRGDSATSWVILEGSPIQRVVAAGSTVNVAPEGLTREARSDRSPRSLERDRTTQPDSPVRAAHESFGERRVIR
jgi:hypothetical protein